MAEADLIQELHRRPTRQELAERMGSTCRDISKAKEALGCFAPTSVDEHRDEGRLPLTDVLGSEDPGIASLDTSLSLAAALATLTQDDKALLRLRFVDDLSQAEIGERIGASQSQVSRRLTRILNSLRGQLNDW